MHLRNRILIIPILFIITSSMLVDAQEVNSNGLYWNVLLPRTETCELIYDGVRGSFVDTFFLHISVTVDLPNNISSWSSLPYACGWSSLSNENTTDVLRPVILPDPIPEEINMEAVLIYYPVLCPVGNWTYLSELVAAEYQDMKCIPMESATFWGFEIDTSLNTDFSFHPNFNISLYCRVGYLKSNGLITFISIEIADLTDDSTYQSTEFLCMSIMNETLQDDMTAIPGWWNNYGEDDRRVFWIHMTDYLLRLGLIASLLVGTYIFYNRIKKGQNGRQYPSLNNKKKNSEALF